MKKLLLSSIVLFLFSASILMFQASCKKEANASKMPGIQSENLGILLISKMDENNRYRHYTSDYDGKNIKEINIPINIKHFERVRLSPDGKTVVIMEYPSMDIYTCSTDGSNLKKVFSGSETGYFFEEVY